MNKHTKKMIAPIIITILFLIYFIGILIAACNYALTFWEAAIAIIVPAALATKRMTEEAEQMGADAIVNIRYASSAVMQGVAEIMAYGTAVKFI